MLHLRQLGEVPLLVMPERYIFAQAQKGPKKPLNSLVQSWLSGNSLFVVSDDEPDDAVWIFASLYGKTGDRGRYIVTRDKAANHRASIWGIDFGDSLQDLELERSFRRWSALYLRWHALSWDGCNHSGAVTVRIDGMPPLSTEIQQHEGIWYIPEATGARWLQISCWKKRARSTNHRTLQSSSGLSSFFPAAPQSSSLHSPSQLSCELSGDNPEPRTLSRGYAKTRKPGVVQ